VKYKDIYACPVVHWSTVHLRNAAPEYLLRRLKADITFVTKRQPRWLHWSPAFLRRAVSAMFPDGLGDLVSLDRSRPAAVEAANVDAAFLLLDYFGPNTALMRSALAVVLWITNARRTTLNVAARYCGDDPDIDKHLIYFLNLRRCQRFKKDLRL
jgi:hypothetical protein